MRQGLYLLCLLTQIACQKWEPSVERIAALCGPVSKDARVLRFTEPSGTSLYSNEPYDFGVYFQTADGSWRDLGVNSYGCVEAPQENGTLVARSRGRDWAFARAYDPGSSRRYEELPVVEVGTQTWKLACPSGGWIADDKLNNALIYTGSNSQIFTVQIESNGLGLALKKPGLALNESLQALDLSALHPGRHELNLFVGLAGPDALPAIPSARCPLEIVRHEPGFAAESWKDGAVIAAQERRSASPTVPGDRLMVCRQPGYSTDLNQACEISPACRDAENFVETDGFAFDQPGPFTYAYYLKNRAGRTSPMQCRRVFVSDKAPDFSLSWKESAWNDEQHIESTLPAVMEAEIKSIGHSIDPGRPASTFSCKVDFVYRGELVAPGDGVQCLSGLCEGQSLEHFVPCDGTLRFTAAKAFDSDLLLNSELRLTVVADDGAGQVSQHTRALFLQHAQNMIFSTAISLPALSSREEVGGFWHTPQGGLLVRVDGSKTYRFFETTRLARGSNPAHWREIPSPLPENLDLRINNVVVTDQGSIYSSWTWRDARQDSHTAMARLENGAWTEIHPMGWDGAQKRCELLFHETADNFLCLQNDTRDIRLERLSFSKLPENVPMPELPLSCSNGVIPLHGVYNSKKELFIFCRKDVAYKRSADGTWQNFSLPKNYNLQPASITWDELEQPWLVMSNTSGGMIVAPSRMAEPIPLPAGIEGPVRRANETFGFDRLHRLRMGPYIWDAASKNWNIDNSLVEIMGDEKIQVKAIQGDPGALFFEGSALSLLQSAEGARRIFPRASLQWPTPSYKPTASALLHGVKMGKQGQLCFTDDNMRTHVRCILRKNWSQIGAPFTRLASIPVAHSYIANDAGEFLIATGDGIFEQSGSSWRKVLPSPPEMPGTWLLQKDTLWATVLDKVYRIDRQEKIWRLAGRTDENQATLPRFASRQSFIDGKGQNWFSTRLVNQDKLSSRTLLKFTGDQFVKVRLPDNWDPFEYIPLGQDLIILTTVHEGGSSQLKIMSLDIQTHAIRERDPAEWNLDLSVLAGRNLVSMESSEHQEAVIVLDKVDKDLPPVVLDFRLKKQIALRSFPTNRDPIALVFARLPLNDYLAVILDKTPIFSIAENYSFQRIKADGAVEFLYDFEDMRTMESRPKLRVTPIVPAMDAGSNMWIRASEYLSDMKQPELFLFDLEALSGGLVWKSHTTRIRDQIPD